jgi:hypothetical protein
MLRGQLEGEMEAIIGKGLGLIALEARGLTWFPYLPHRERATARSNSDPQTGQSSRHPFSRFTKKHQGPGTRSGHAAPQGLGTRRSAVLRSDTQLADYYPQQFTICVCLGPLSREWPLVGARGVSEGVAYVRAVCIQCGLTQARSATYV